MELQLEFFSNTDAYEYLVMFCSEWTVAESAQDIATSSFKFPKTNHNIECLQQIKLGSLVYIPPVCLVGCPLEKIGFVQKIKQIVETADQFTIYTQSMTYLDNRTFYCSTTYESSGLTSTVYAFNKYVLSDTDFNAKYGSPAWWGDIGKMATSTMTYISKDLFPYIIGSFYTFKELITSSINLEEKGLTYYYYPTITRADGKKNKITVNSTITFGYNTPVVINLDDDYISGQSITIFPSEKTNKVILYPDHDNAYYTEIYTLDVSAGHPVVLTEQTYTDSDVNDSEESTTAEQYLEKKAREIINSESEDDAQLALNFGHSILDMSMFMFYRAAKFTWHETISIESKYIGFSASNNFDSISMTFGYKNISIIQKIKAGEERFSKANMTKCHELSRRIRT